MKIIEIISLRNNKIAKIETEAFLGLNYLDEISLDGNKLNQLDFVQLNSLKKYNVSRKKFTHFNAGNISRI